MGAELNKKAESLKVDVNVSKKKTDHVLLTERDFDLMTALHDHVVLSFGQIHENFYAGRAISTAMNRLKKIEGQGLIERLRISRLRIQGRKNTSGVVFQLSGQGRMLLARERPEVTVFEKCPLLNLHQLDHDLLVADIAEHFKRRFPDHQWTNGRYLLDSVGFKKIPDAVLRKTTPDRAIAIELELNGKSLRRYKDIVAVLKTSARIEKVIFVTASHTIGRKIMSAIEGYQVPFGHSLRSDFFEFVRLTDCLKVNSDKR
ncbi:replication-relaxation family protein [bacterium]|nr:replication-relaxation family protein [bacterium]